MSIGQLGVHSDEQPQPLLSPAYCVAPFVHYCKTEDGVIFLDLKRDSYLGIGDDDVAAFEQLLQVTRSPANQQQPLSQSALRLASLLSEKGIICAGAQSARPAARDAPPTPDSTLAESIHDGRATIRPVDVSRFAAALARAKIKLRLLPLWRAVETVACRKVQAARERSRTESAQVGEIASKYFVMRAFAFTATNACLLDSLVLTEFLAAYGIFPCWVLGVRSRPFEAHSWVQHDSCVLNGTLEYIRTYTPILTV